MIDYLAWAKADPLTVEQAARLWAEVDPSTPQYMWTPAQSAAIGARLQMLFGRITNRELQVNHSGNGLEFIGRYERSTILRSELKALAARLEERPRFLFTASNEESQEGETAPSGAAATKAERVPAPTVLSQAGLDKAAISRLIGHEITKTSDSSPPPLRVMPGARRISKAPPPPQYVRGTIGPLPARTSIVAPAAAPITAVLKAPNPAAVARASAETPPDNRAIKAWLMLEQARRIKKSEPCGMNEVRVYLRGEFPHLSRDDADRFYEALDPDLKPRRGPKGAWKNKR